MFREVLLKIGEIRSFIPPTVHIMCLTATATVELRKKSGKYCWLKEPKIFTVSPCKANIMFVVKSYDSLINAFRPLIKKLKLNCSNFPRTIIYCRKLSDCGIPSDAPDMPQFRVVDMFHSQ